jgi:phage-related holin
MILVSSTIFSKLEMKITWLLITKEEMKVGWILITKELERLVDQGGSQTQEVMIFYGYKV